MPDDQKPSALFSSVVPKEVKDFVDCKIFEVNIAPQEFVLGGFKVKLTFESGDKGSVIIRLDAPGDFFDSTIDVSIQNGELVADTSKLGMFKDEVQKWVRDFNTYLNANGNQLSGVSIQNGKLHVNKIKVAAGTKVGTASEVTPGDTALTPPPPPLPDHVVDPIPRPVVVETGEVISEIDAVPDLSDLGTDADSGSVDDQGQIDFGEAETGEVVSPPVPPPPFHNQYPVPPAVEVETPNGPVDESGTASEAEQDSEIGFIEDPPISEAGKNLGTYRTAFAAVILAAIAVFLFAVTRDNTAVVPASDQPIEAVTDSETTSGTEDQAGTDSETTSGTGSGEVQPISSAHFADPAGDNGGNGTGGDILGLEYIQADTFTVLLTMGDPPLKSSVDWFSYYIEVKLKRMSGATQVLIFEKHGELSRSGELDSSGDAKGVGVELSDESASFKANADVDDPVVEICVVVYSLVNEGDQVTEDTMTVEVR